MCKSGRSIGKEGIFFGVGVKAVVVSVGYRLESCGKFGKVPVTGSKFLCLMLQRPIFKMSEFEVRKDLLMEKMWECLIASPNPS